MELLEKILKEKQFKNIYLFFGVEEYLKALYEKKFIDAIVVQSARTMNFDILEGKLIEVSTIKDISDTLPFMNEYRLVLVKNSNLFADGRKAETEKLLQYIENIPSSTILLFLEEKVDKKSKIFKEVKKIGEVFEFNNLSEKDLVSWIFKKFYENNKTIDDTTSIYFIRNVGDNMELLSNEITKLVNYSSYSKITKEDIDEICTKLIESKIFDLVNCIGNKNIENALTLYKGLIFNKVAPFLILSMIARQFKMILQVKYLDKKGENIYNISKILEIRSFVVKEILKESKNFTYKVLLDAINECLDIDSKAKLGLLNYEMQLEIFIIKYCSVSNKINT